MPDADWYRPRRYAHLDWPISRAAAEELATNPERVAKHAFLPFIRYSLTEPRYKPDRKMVEDKVRPIAFASHADSHIFSYYAHILRQRLEQRLSEAGVSSSVIAYRRFPGGKCNVHFADDVFEEVRRRKSCATVAIDVESFFDSLDHRILKAAWCQLLGFTRLPPDHYAVFKAITRFAAIDRDAYYREFDIGRRQQERLRGPVCSPREFRERVRGKGLVQSNRTGIGIPQGSPISAVLSNIYMIAVDIAIQQYAERISAVYRRYSDDILLISTMESQAGFEDFVSTQLSSIRLKVNSHKTQRSLFAVGPGGAIICDNALQYLGFTFDGTKKLIRPKTLARYIRRMKDGVRSAARAASKARQEGGDGRIRRRELYERFSHLGRRNFVRYAYRAAQIMKETGPKRQLRKHWKRLHDTIREEEQEREE